MNGITPTNLWLIGASQMAKDYGLVLSALNISYKVIGRGKKSAADFESAMEFPVQTGGIEKALQLEPPPKIAIVAVGIEQLASVTIQLVQAGTRKILLEKPGGMNLEELENLQFEAQLHQAEVWLAYNRRFYESTRKVLEIMEEDGGATSCNFEFTEWSHTIRGINSKTDIKEMWFLANSTHVVDLVFYLCGCPADWRSWSIGTLDWHPVSARFSGAGMTDQGILFSYFADWEAPGRWGIEILTRKNRLILRPMEQLQITTLGSVEAEPFILDDKLDRDFKPGLYQQTKAFLLGEATHFCTLDQHLKHTTFYLKMAGYEKL